MSADRRARGARSDLMERLVRVLLREPDATLTVVRADGETRATLVLEGHERPLVSLVGRATPAPPAAAQPELPFRAPAPSAAAPSATTATASATAPTESEVFVLSRAAWDRLGETGRMRLERPIEGGERVYWSLGGTAVHSEPLVPGVERWRALVRAEESVGLHRQAWNADGCDRCLCTDAVPCANGCEGRESGCCSRCTPVPAATAKRSARPRLSPASKPARAAAAKPLPRAERGTVLVFRDEDRNALRRVRALDPARGGLGNVSGGSCRPFTYVLPAPAGDPRLDEAIAALAKAGAWFQRVDDATLELAQQIVTAERLGSKARPAKALQHAAKGSPPRVLDAKPEGGTP